MFAGCATPQYAVYPVPAPVESPAVRQFETEVSDYQAALFDRDDPRPLRRGQRVWGFDVVQTVERISQVTERAALAWRVFLYQDDEPNAAALPDGRIYISRGMLNYLASRGSRESELAFVLAHELAHTTAQHLLERYEQLQRQGLVMGLVGLGAAIVARQSAEVGGLIQDVGTLVNDVVASGYSQAQELEADQLGIRYCLRAGYDPQAALSLLEDFQQFEVPWPFFRTHPYIERRTQDLRQYLAEGAPGTQVPGPGPSSHDREALRRRLREAQKLYPVGSQSWRNLQRQLEELERLED